MPASDRACASALVRVWTSPKRERAELVDDHRLVREAGGQRDRSRGRAAPEAGQRGAAPSRACPGRIGRITPASTSTFALPSAYPIRPVRPIPGSATSSLLLRTRVAGSRSVRSRLRPTIGADTRSEIMPNTPPGRVVGQPQRHARAAVRGLAQAPAPALVDAGDVGPAQVAGLVELHHLHQAAHVRRAHVHAHREARAQAAARALRRRRSRSFGSQCVTVHEPRVGGRVAHPLPDLLARGVDRRRLLDPHQPSTGRRAFRLRAP